MKIEINVPTSLSEITLGQYQKFVKISENNPEGNFLDAKMIEIFCGIPLSESYKLRISSVAAILDILNELLSGTPEHVERFTMQGVEYGFVPDLDDMSLGEYISLDESVSKWDAMTDAMHVLYRPIKNSNKDKYSIEEYKVEGHEVLENMPLSAVFGSLFFFLNLGTELSSHTILYSNKEDKEAIQNLLTSHQNGVGINQFMDSLQDVLKNLKISLN